MLAFIVASTLATGIVAADFVSPPPMTPPTIDGVIGADEWGDAPAIALEHQTQPGDNVSPSASTEVRFGHDDEYLYVAFIAQDAEQSGIRGRVTRRDDIAGDDYVVLYLDTFDDRRRAYVFWFNPLGIQADGIYTEGVSTGRDYDSNIDRTWDGILVSKGRITDEGFIVEAAIPFRTLRFPGGADRRWGLHVERWIARKGERISWRPISRDVSSLLTQMGQVSGLGDLSTGPAIEVIPTATWSLTGDRRSDGRMVDVGKFDPGVTSVWSITPNLTFGGTLNPDFSQIEADEPQIEVNQRFPLLYAEKRPFFYEGGEVFRSPGALNFLNTRQIVDPDWGAKLTGKTGRNTIGLLAARDRAPGQRVQAGGPGADDPAYALVGRYQRDFLQNSTIGGFVSDHQFAGRRNTVLATDGQLRLPLNTIGFQLAKSWTNDAEISGRGGALAPPSASTAGDATYLWYDFVGRHWRLLINDQRISGDYEATTAYVRRRGFHANSANAGYEFQSPSPSWWVRARPFVAARRLQTGAGLLDESYTDPGADVTLARDVSIYTYYSFRRDSFGGREYPYRFYHGGLVMNTFKRLTVDSRLQVGEGVNFSAARAEVGRFLSVNVIATLRPSAQLNSEWRVLRSQLRAMDGDEWLYRQTIVRNRTNYQFTRDHASRVIAEYNTLSRRLALSLLYSWTPRPNTAVFVGYGDILVDDLVESDAHDIRNGLTRVRRTVFVKLSRGIGR